MNNDRIIIIPIVILLLLALFKLFCVINARIIVRKFFKKAVNAESLYQYFCLAKDCSMKGNLNFHINISKDDIKEILNYHEQILSIAEQAIEIYDKEDLFQFEEEYLDKTYIRLREIACEMRRWKWVNEEQ